jgi:hypothetical protein
LVRRRVLQAFIDGKRFSVEIGFDACEEYVNKYRVGVLGFSSLPSGEKEGSTPFLA